nr:DUF4956 domain-containing protein [Propionibacterium sp.]
MLTTTALLYLANVGSILFLTLGLYFPRHRRRDLVVAYLGVNIGIMAVSSVLLSTAVGAGLGLGLFGVLSIIRLRSDELAQHEIAYYFSALALGLLSGLGAEPVMALSLMAVVVAGMFVADHPLLLRGYRREVVVIDRAMSDRAAITAHLEQRLGGRVHHISVQKLDLVNDTTWVDVRYRETAPAVAGDQSERIESAR